MCLRKELRPAAGYAFVALMILVTVLLISLTAALPSIYQEGQREREAEAIFRATQYARAIFLFHRQYGRFPVSVKDLINTNGNHFLRKAWRDPLSPNGRWRFIHANAAGMLIDSWNQTSATVTPHAMPLATGSGQGAPGQPSSGFGQTPSGPAQSVGGFSQAPSQASQPSSGFGQTPGGASQPSPGSGLSSGSSGQEQKPKHPPSTCDEESQGQGLGSESSDEIQTGTLLGAFIVGVAPCSDKQSIRVLDKKDHYDEWEVVATDYKEYSMPRATQPGQPGQSSGFQPNSSGQPGLLTPPSNPSSPGGFGSPQSGNGTIPNQQ